MKKTMVKVINTISVLLLAIAVMFSAVAFVAMPIQAWSGTMASTFASGSGTSTSPYIIKTVAQFGYFMNQLNSGVTYEGLYIKIGANLDLSGESWTYESTASFNGTLDGQCYTITSNSMILPDIGAAGVVQKVNAKATELVDSSLLCRDNSGTIRVCTVRGAAASGVMSGLLCQENYGTVQYCGAVGSARGVGDDCDSYAGMVAMNKGTIDGCFSAMTVSASAPGKYNDPHSHPLANGQWGYATTATNSYYDKTLYTYSTTLGTGLTTTEMQSSAFLQMISGNTLAGAKWVSGSDGYPTLQSCTTSTVTISGYAGMTEATYHTYAQKVTLVRSGSGTIYYTTDGTDPTSSSTRKYSSSSSVSVTLSGDMVLTAVVYYNSSYGAVTRTQFVYMPGSGTASSPYQILSKRGLSAVRLDTTAYYRMGTSLSFTSADYEFGGVAAGGWTPIPSFSGTFDGNGYSISGLQGTRGGLFDENSGTITSVRMVDHKLLADGKSGPIANRNNSSGIITRCYAKSAFTLSTIPSTIDPEFYVYSGGIVGYSSGSVSYCRTEGIVAGREVSDEGQQYVGGIAGWGSDIDSCVSNALIVCSGYPNYIYAGGITGAGSSGVQNCCADASFYVKARVDYDAYIGGISGHFYSSYAYYCVAGDLDITEDPNAYVRLYRRAWAVNNNYCYKTSTGNLPESYTDLDFDTLWMMTDDGPVPQGVMDADGHCYSLVSYSGPDCYNQGITVGKCDLCGTTKQFISSDTIHTLVLDEGTDPTCTETGLTNGYHCELCSKIVTEQEEIEPLGHSFTNYVSNEDYTCTEDGTETAQCDRCEATDKRTEEGSAHHIFTEYVSDLNATCTADGTKTAVCENCEETDTLADAGTMLPHSFTEYVSDDNATYTEDGTETAKCDKCEATDTRTETGTKIAPVSISVATMPEKVSYLTGESLVTTGLTFEATYENGDTVTFDVAAAESIAADLSVSGRKNVVLTYMGQTTEYEILVHDIAVVSVLVDSSLYPESSHSYANNLSETKTFTYAGAQKLEITFNSSTKVESNYDYIYIYDGNGTQVAKYTGTAAAGKTITITGDTFKVKLTSDGSSVAYGYGFSSIYAYTDSAYHPPVVDPATVTCTQSGLCEGAHCEICGIVLSQQQEVDPLGHSFTNYVSDNNATGTTDGTKTAQCDRCEATDTVTDEGSKLAPVAISVITPPTNVNCAINTLPALDGLTLLATFDNAEDVVLSAEMVESYTADTGAAGECAATVSYMGQTTTFAVYAHELISQTIDAALYPESAHPYSSNSNETQVFTWSGAQSLTVTFDASTYVESNYDKIYLYDGADNLLATYTNTSAAGVTITISGDTFKVKLTSDKSVQKWGYAFSSIIANDVLNHPVVTEPGADASCTEPGLTAGGYCEICGMTLVEQEVIEPQGHDMGDWSVTKEATCTEDGEKVRSCEREGCDHSETETIEATGHDWSDATCTAPKTCSTCGETEGKELGHDMGDWSVTKEATCTEDGEKTRSCERDGCDHTETEAIEATGHIYTSVVTAPTCTEEGYTTHTCACGDNYVDSYVDELGHNMSEWETTKEATCTEDGEKTRSCEREGCEHTETEVIEASGHAHTSTITAPTCTEKGYTTHTCACGDAYVDSYEDALGHEMGDWETTNEATCTEDGEKTRSCEREDCEHTETEVIEATGHTHTSVVTAPTCTAKGYTTHTCACGDSYVDSYEDALGHDMSDWVVTEEATCTEDGEKARSCEREGCDHTETEAIEASGHTHTSVVTAPTCTEKGYTTHTCACGDAYVDSYEDALGHEMGDWETTNEATCTEDGEKTRSCEREDCEHTETEVIEATGHTEESVPGYAATCTETGLNEGKKCTTCGTSTVEQTIIPATGHNWSEGVCGNCGAACDHSYDENGVCGTCGIGCAHDYAEAITAPTCTAQGYTTYTCNTCGHSYTGAFVDALGHSWIDATCTTPKTCSVCNATEGTPNGHKYTIAITAPTCTEKGYTTHTCACGDSYVDSYVDELGHEMGDWETTKEATCTEDGEKVRSCERNGCDHTETEAIEASGHTYTTVVTAPTCTEKGYTTHTCACGDSYIDSYVDELGHDMSEWEITKEATCTEDGEKARSCEREGCEHTETEVIEASGHTHTSVVTAPTCTAKGYTTHTCTCGDSYVDSYEDALGHEMGDWETTNEATCTEDGEKARNCDRDGCDHTETEAIEASGHTYESVVTAPTCTEKGYTTHTCACGDGYVDSYVDELGHEMGEWTVVSEPTAAANGEERRECSRCEHYESREIAYEETAPVSVNGVTVSENEDGSFTAVADVTGGSGFYAYNYWLFDSTGTIVDRHENTFDTSWTFEKPADGIYLMRIYATDFGTESYNDSSWFAVTSPYENVAVSNVTVVENEDGTYTATADVTGSSGFYAYNYWLFDSTGTIVDRHENTFDTSWTFQKPNDGIYLMRIYATDFTTDAYNDSSWFAVTSPYANVAVSNVTVTENEDGTYTAVADVTGSSGFYAYNYWLFDSTGTIVDRHENTFDTSWTFEKPENGIYLMRIYATDFTTDSYNDSSWFAVMEDNNAVEDNIEDNAEENDAVELQFVALSLVDGQFTATAQVSNGTGYVFTYHLIDSTGEIVDMKADTYDKFWTFEMPATPGMYLVRVYATNFVTTANMDTAWIHIGNEGDVTVVYIELEKNTDNTLTVKPIVPGEIVCTYNYCLYDSDGNIIDSYSDTNDAQWTVQIPDANKQYYVCVFATDHVTEDSNESVLFTLNELP